MKILIVYYSMYGHVYQLARGVEEGAKSVAGAEVLVRRVQEFDAVNKIIDGNDRARAERERQKDVSVVTLDDLRQADGIIFGTPTRYGNMTAQLKQLFDSTASLWLKGELEGKVAGAFTSTATAHGGQETTIYTMIPPIVHLGMIFVGVPYSVRELLHVEGRGGSPYGPSTLAGPMNDLPVREEDLVVARALGKRVAEIAKKLRGG